MSTGDMIWFVVFITCLPLSVGLLVASRTREDTSGSRFIRGWLLAFGLLFGLAGCAGLCGTIAVFGTGSVPERVVAVILNAVAQPAALLLCWGGAGNIGAGLLGRVPYAGRRAPEAEVSKMPPHAECFMRWHGVARGVVGVVLGLGISFACAAPIFRMLGD